MHSNNALHSYQYESGVETTIYLLLDVIRRVKKNLEEPTSQDIICTPCDATVLLRLRKRATEDQPQRAMDEFPLEMCKHVGTGIHATTLVVKLFDRVRQLGVRCEMSRKKNKKDIYRW